MNPDKLLRGLTATGIRTFRDSPAFELTLRLDGVAIAKVSNDGRGGCHRWSPPGKCDDYVKQRMFADAIGRAVAACFPSLACEPADCAVTGLADGYPTGFDAAQALSDELAQYADAS